MKRFRAASITTLVLLLWGCDAAEGVRVQPLPPLERPSPEARAGLPEVVGEWRFAGWELAPADSTLLDAELPAFGSLALETQRLDSIAGAYAVPGGRLGLVGEVRRDGVLALAGGSANGRFISGQVTNDTLWVSLTNLLDAAWPAGARAAFVRSPVNATFARLEGQRTILPGDTLPPVLAGIDSLAGERPEEAQPSAIPGTVPSTPPSVEMAPPTAAPPAAQAPEPTPAVEPAPEPEPDPTPEPEPVESAPVQPRPQPRLLGVPVDSTAVPRP